jgi:hypothetical protein
MASSARGRPKEMIADASVGGDRRFQPPGAGIQAMFLRKVARRGVQFSARAM